MVNFVPKQGDIIQLDFSPTKGREQRGKRPALILSNNSFYKNTGLLIVCPISNTDNNFPLHLKLTGENLKTTGVILTQHIKTIDPQAREVLFVEAAPRAIVEQALGMTSMFW